MVRLLLLVATIVVALAVAQASTNFYEDNSLFYETFGPRWDERWIHSQNTKFSGRFISVIPQGWTESALQIPDKSRFYGISALTAEPIDLSQNLVIQYEVKFTEGITCGGAYLKLLTYSSSFTPEGLTNETPYSIMFGPDVCGPSNKIHLIFRHRNPKSGTITEKHLKSPPTMPTDEDSHLYTLVLSSALNKYEILIDGESLAAGSLLSDFEPPFAPPKEILDPSDKKPADWVDAAKIPDPEATQPADWDERIQIPDDSAKKPSGWIDDEAPLIPDPKAQQPEDWEEEEDGVWEPNMIPNPKCKVGCGEWTRPMKHNPNYKGPWSPPLIDNPAYKGKWEQKTLPNPDFFEEASPLKNVGDIGAVAIEVWTVDAGYTFDNIMITNDSSAAREFRERVWRAKKAAEKALASGKGESGSKSLAEMIEAAFDLPYLAAIKPSVQPFLDLMKAYTYLAYGTVFSVLSVVCWLLAGLLGGRKKKTAKVQKKALAKQEEEDEEEEQEEEGSEEEEAEAVKAAPAVAEAAAGASTKLRPVEITEIEEDEEDEEEEVPTTRTRKPKA